ncbi:MAG: DEAD/DEAH box helicase [Hyphomicrobiaceae bacterium]
METTSFSGLGLSPKVLAAIEAAGYTTPTPIQAAAIPLAVSGRDVLGIAQTGTGKTAGFVLPMLARLESGRARARMPRSLILAPTRELAAQVAQSFELYGVNHKLTLALLIGGVSFDEQLRKLDRGVDVLIATPGRLLDHFGRGKLLLTGVEILVIDEADRMLDMGFIPDIERICKLLPPRRQTLFFSATMPPEITKLVGQFMNDPARVEAAPPATTAKTITQRFLFTSSEDREKREALRQLIRGQNVKNAIIFCNRKRDVDILFKSLRKHGFNVGALHGDLDQHQRMATLDAFRNGELQLLAASDVAARGLDIPEVSHVFNFDVPIHSEDYVHRIGRTGRAGREGYAATLVTPDDGKALAEIEKLIKETLTWLGDAPAGEDFNTRKRGRGGKKPAAAASGGRDSGRRGGGERRRGASDQDDGRERQAQRSEERAEPRERQPQQREDRPEPRERRSPEPRREQPTASTSAPASAEGGGRRRKGGSSLHQAGSGEPPRQHTSRKRSGGGDRDEKVVGLGDHVPAFLKRPVRIAQG